MNVCVRSVRCSLSQVDGLSLLCAILNHWLERDRKCPKTLVSTHFHALTQQHLLTNSPVVKYQVRAQPPIRHSCYTGKDGYKLTVEFETKNWQQSLSGVVKPRGDPS